MKTTAPTIEFQIPGLTTEELGAALMAREENRLAHVRACLTARGYAMNVYGPNGELNVSKGRIAKRCDNLDELEAFAREMGAIA